MKPCYLCKADVTIPGALCKTCREKESAYVASFGEDVDKEEVMKFVYTPTTADEPEGFGITLPQPLGLPARFHHLERSEVEALLHSAEWVLREADLANNPRKAAPMSESTMVL